MDQRLRCVPYYVTHLLIYGFTVHADGEFVGDAHRLLWVDPEQVLEDGEERDFLQGGLRSTMKLHRFLLLSY